MIVPLRLAVMVPLSVALGSCILAKDGPQSASIISSASVKVDQPQEYVGFAELALTPSVVDASNRYSANLVRRFHGLRSGRRSSDVSIGVGDIVAVTLFESESGGLFIPKDAASRPGNYVQIPNQQVDKAGNIMVPYAGGVLHVAGRTTFDVANEISRRLRSRAIDPQTVVSVVEHRGNAVSVLGEVSAPLRFSLDPGGISLTGAIAKAGGPKNPAYETIITLKRHGASYVADMTAVVRESSQDVPLMPGDMVYLSKEPRVFMALGATATSQPIVTAGGLPNNRRFTFENENMTLAEAISKAGGLSHFRADPSHVFLFRFEKPELLASLGVDTRRFNMASVPTVYKIDFSAADTMFLANSFNMRDKDIIFASEAGEADLHRILSLLQGASGAAVNAAQTSYFSGLGGP